MKKIYNLILMVVAIVAVSACYKDLGNYEYSYNGGEGIEFGDDFTTEKEYQITENIVIEPDLIINDINIDSKNLAYEWYFGDKVISTEKILEMPNPGTGSFTGMLVVTDLANNQRYSQYFSIKILASYNHGWAIGTEKDGVSDFSYLTVNKETNEFLPIQKNVYSTIYGGKKIEGVISEIAYHYYDSFGQIPAISIVSDGDEGPIDLKGGDMSTYGYIKKGFRGAAPNLDFKSVVYKQEYVYALTADGEIYLRNEKMAGGGWFANPVPHAGKFSSVPIYTGYDLKVKEWINNSLFSTMVGTEIAYTVAYNEAEENFIYLKDGEVTEFSEILYSNKEEPHMPGDPVLGFDGLTYPGPEDMSAYEVLDIEGCGIEMGMMDAYFGVTSLLKSKKSINKFLFSYRFYGTDVDLDIMMPFPSEINIDPATMITYGNMGGRKMYYFFTDKGNKNLYFFDTILGYTRKLYTSTSPITAMSYGEAGNAMALQGYGVPTHYKDMFMIGSEDGKIVVLDLSDSAFTSGNLTEGDAIYTENIGEGKISSIEYLSVDAASF